VPILPLIDLLILMSTASLLVGFLLKAVAITTRYRPTVLGFSSIDFVIITGVCLGMALVLAARTWVKLNEPQLQRMRARLDLRRGAMSDVSFDEPDAPTAREAAPEAVQADHR
jgi:hypothetical protein